MDGMGLNMKFIQYKVLNLAICPLSYYARKFELCCIQFESNVTNQTYRLFWALVITRFVHF